MLSTRIHQMPSYLSSPFKRRTSSLSSHLGWSITTKLLLGTRCSIRILSRPTVRPWKAAHFRVARGDQALISASVYETCTSKLLLEPHSIWTFLCLPTEFRHRRLVYQAHYHSRHSYQSWLLGSHVSAWNGSIQQFAVTSYHQSGKRDAKWSVSLLISTFKPKADSQASVSWNFPSLHSDSVHSRRTLLFSWKSHWYSAGDDSTGRPVSLPRNIWRSNHGAICAWYAEWDTSFWVEHVEWCSRIHQ